MKSYLIENYANLQGLIGISFMFLMLAIIFISYVINGYNYKIIAKAYENKFGFASSNSTTGKRGEFDWHSCGIFRKNRFYYGEPYIPI